MATARPPSGGTGGTPTATIGFNYSALRNAPNVARESGRAVARELQNALKQVQVEQAAADRQRTASMQATLTQRRIAVRAAAREEAETQRTAAAQQAASDRQRTAELKAALRQRVIAVKAAAREEAAALRQSQVSAGAFRRGAASFAGAAFAGPIGGLAGALAGGGPALAAGLAVSEGSRFAVEAAQTATAYNRQRLASENLAGSQAKLNELLIAYQRASGGAVDKAAALSNVTRLQAVGFADNAKEVDRFTRGVRGASIAMGKVQDEISQEVQLAISNQSLKRLDQIGLGISEVNDRIEQLRASNQGMTREAAFQEAVLGLLNEKYGALTVSAVGAATGVERLGKAWKDFQLGVGQTSNQSLGGFFEFWARGIENTIKALDEFDRKIQRSIWRVQGLNPDAMEFAIASDDRAINAATMGASKRAGRGAQGFDEDQVAALRRREEGFAEIDRDEATARLEATRSYERQRTQTIADFEKQRSREAADFGRQRLYAERKFNLSLLDVAQDSARQRSKWEEDSERTIAKARQDTAKRLSDLDADFKKDQKRRQKDFRDDMLSAAGRLDAIALLELRKDRARELEDRKEAHEEQRSDLQEQLHEREREERDSLARRIDEQRENDALRIEEMKAAFEESRIQEDEERAIRLGRQAEDHGDQLDELDRVHGERLQQIIDQAAKERDQFTEQSNIFLEEVGIHNQKWLDEQGKINAGVIRRHEELLEAQRRALLGSYGQKPGFPSLADPYKHVAPVPSTTFSAPVPGSMLVPPPSSTYNPRGGWESSRTINIHPGAIVIQGDGLNEREVVELLVETLEEWDH